MKNLSISSVLEASLSFCQDLTLNFNYNGTQVEQKKRFKLVAWIANSDSDATKRLFGVLAEPKFSAIKVSVRSKLRPKLRKTPNIGRSKFLTRHHFSKLVDLVREQLQKGLQFCHFPKWIHVFANTNPKFRPETVFWISWWTFRNWNIHED